MKWVVIELYELIRSQMQAILIYPLGSSLYYV